MLNGKTYLMSCEIEENVVDANSSTFDYIPTKLHQVIEHALKHIIWKTKWLNNIKGLKIKNQNNKVSICKSCIFYKNYK